MNDPTFVYRVAIGLSLFALLAIVDLVRNRENTSRLKEYAFLFGVTGLTMLYAVVHDGITCTLSPEYFQTVKGLNAKDFHRQVVELALGAGWSAGLVIGTVLLVANNPSQRLAQLPYIRLCRRLLWPTTGALLAAAVLSLCPLSTPEGWLSATLEASTREQIERVWRIHLGSYLGAALGLFIAAGRVRIERRAVLSGGSAAVSLAPRRESDAPQITLENRDFL